MYEEKKNEILDQEKGLDMDELDAVAGGGEACGIDKACGCTIE